MSDYESPANNTPDILFYEALAQEAERLKFLVAGETAFVPSTDEVLDLKDTINNDPDLGDEVCSYIASALYIPGLAEDKEMTVRATRREVAYASNVPQNPVNIIRAIGGLAAQWRRSLDQGLHTPGSEWPEGSTGAAIFIQALRRLKAEASTDQ